MELGLGRAQWWAGLSGGACAGLHEARSDSQHQKAKQSGVTARPPGLGLLLSVTVGASCCVQCLFVWGDWGQGADAASVSHTGASAPRCPLPPRTFSLVTARSGDTRRAQQDGRVPGVRPCTRSRCTRLL